MNAKELKVFLDSVARLTPSQKEASLAELRVAGQGDEVLALVESRLNAMKACHHCQSTRVVRNGSASGLERYKCRACVVTFHALSATPLARLRMKAKWFAQQDVLQQGLSVKQAAMSLEVARTTAFRWRHRFLQLTQAVKAQELAGVVEVHETFFLRSNKGQPSGRKARKRDGRASRTQRGDDLIPILVARDRSGATAEVLLEAVS